MPYLYPKDDKYRSLEVKNNENVSLIYHNIFDYPLTFAELIKWAVGSGAKDLINALSKKDILIKKNGDFYFLQGRDGLISKIPTIKMVAVTGALAMRNAGEDADIDLMIVTQKNTLWTTRLFTLLLLDILGLPRRKYGEKNQKDKLCLNIWLDEKDIYWRKRNIFIAHEICQIIPLVNKDKTYQKFIYKNRWIYDFWPNSVKLLGEKDIKILERSRKNKFISECFNLLVLLTLEPLSFWLQYQFMKRKITKEKVSKTRALFHPYDWSKAIHARLQI